MTVTALLDKIVQGCYSNHLDICTVVCISIQLWNITIFSARFHISAQAALASPRSVKYGTHVSRRPFHYQPYRVGSGTHKCFCKAQCQTKAKTRSVLLTCWYKAAFVGGMLNYCECSNISRRTRTSFMVTLGQLLLYRAL